MSNNKVKLKIDMLCGEVSIGDNASCYVNFRKEGGTIFIDDVGGGISIDEMRSVLDRLEQIEV